MDRQPEIKKQIDRLASRYFLIGLALDVLIGAVIGFVVAYTQGSPTTVVLPLTRGVQA
jgi:hypothetical protein